MVPETEFLGKTVSLTVGKETPGGAFSAVLTESKAPAYLLGEKAPPARTDARVIGVFMRGSGEAVLLCVPGALAGSPICWECNLLHALRASEDVGSDSLFPLYERTSGAVLYTEQDGARRYLLVKSKSGHIGFPKGHIEYGETELENAAREIFEETGLPFSPHPDFRMEYTYTTLDRTEKTGVFFLSRYDGRALSFQKEEVFADWLVPYEKAMALLNFPQDREILQAAEALLTRELKENL